MTAAVRLGAAVLMRDTEVIRTALVAAALTQACEAGYEKAPAHLVDSAVRHAGDLNEL